MSRCSERENERIWKKENLTDKQVIGIVENDRKLME